MLSATLRVCGCRGNVGDDGWAEGRRSCPPPKREKRFKNAVMKKKSQTLPALTLTRPSIPESSRVPGISVTLWKYLNLFLIKHPNVIS